MASAFQETLTAAVADLSKYGYDSAERMAIWVDRIRRSAEASLVPPDQLADALRRTLGTTYDRLVTKGGIARQQGIARWTVERVRPQLRAELDRRIMASAGLIKLSREEAIEKVVRRFSGWGTSIPPGGSRAVETREVKTGISKSLAQLPFADRRVIIDQGHKLNATLNEIVAVDNGAIAVEWHSTFQAGYNYRPDHRERNGKVYAIRGNWAMKAGLMKVGPDGYYDEVTAVAEEPFCRCSGGWRYALRDLPSDMVTKKGEAELARVRSAMGAA